MPWYYDRKTGYVTKTPGGIILYVGYSGHNEGRNNPDLSHQPNVGPIPPGGWNMIAMIDKTPEHGPYVIRLLPDPETNTFGRSGFLIHGDSIKAPGTASLGCIILPRLAREAMWRSDDKKVVVT